MSLTEQALRVLGGPGMGFSCTSPFGAWGGSGSSLSFSLVVLCLQPGTFAVLVSAFRLI